HTRFSRDWSSDVCSSDLFVAISVSLPPGSSLERTTKIMEEVEVVLKPIEANKTLMGLSGFNIITQSSSSSFGVVFLNLKPSEERGEIKDINAIMDEARQRLSAIKGANFFVFTFPTAPGFSNVDGLDFVLQDKSGGSLTKFSEVGNNFIGELMKRPEI